MLAARALSHQAASCSRSDAGCKWGASSACVVRAGLEQRLGGGGSTTAAAAAASGGGRRHRCRCGRGAGRRHRCQLAPPPAAVPSGAPEPGSAEAALDDFFANGPDGARPRPALEVLRRKWNAKPDFDADGGWVKEVDDWSEFWGTSAWTEAELREIEALEDDDAAAAAAAGLDGDGGAAADDADARGAAGLARAQALLAALRSARRRADVERVLGPADIYPAEARYGNAARMNIEERTVENPNPLHDELYLRAMVEKRERRAALDAEWRRLQGLVGALPPRDYTRDARLVHDHDVRENWSHEQVRALCCVCLIAACASVCLPRSWPP